MAGIRERAKQILMVVPEPPGVIYSDGPTATQFTNLTGTPHETMRKNWEGGGIMTACNGFVGWYAGQLGSDKYLGRFDLEAFLPTIGKGHAWAKSTADARPKYGDICRHTAYHVDVALDFDGNIFNRVGAGAEGSGPVRKEGVLVGGHDVLKRTRGTAPYDFKKLQGWIDLELYFESAPQTGPIPEWLAGWWNVTWRGQAYYYYFDRNRQVKWTQDLPRDTSQPPPAASDTGTFAVEPNNAVTIRWGATGNVEKLGRVVGTDDLKMGGTWNGTEPLTAVKM